MLKLPTSSKIRENIEPASDYENELARKLCKVLQERYGGVFQIVNVYRKQTYGFKFEYTVYPRNMEAFTADVHKYIKAMRSRVYSAPALLTECENGESEATKGSPAGVIDITPSGKLVVSCECGADYGFIPGTRPRRFVCVVCEQKHVVRANGRKKRRVKRKRKSEMV